MTVVKAAYMCMLESRTWVTCALWLNILAVKVQYFVFVQASFSMVDGGLQCISMQSVKALLEANYAYLSGVW